jgi:hypothetical protein
MTPAELAELERLEKDATPGRWLMRIHTRESTTFRHSVCSVEIYDEKCPLPMLVGPDSKEPATDDARLLVFLRNHASELLSAASRASMLEERNGKLEEAHTRTRELLEGLQAHFDSYPEGAEAYVTRAEVAECLAEFAPSTKGEG